MAGKGRKKNVAVDDGEALPAVKQLAAKRGTKRAAKDLAVASSSEDLTQAANKESSVALADKQVSSNDVSSSSTVVMSNLTKTSKSTNVDKVTEPPTKKSRADAGTAAATKGKTTASKATSSTQQRKAMDPPLVKKPKLTAGQAGHHESHGKVGGFVLTMGEGDTGSLGLGPDILDRTRPARVKLPADCVQVCAGGMHSICLSITGQVFTFGCNDEGALGRITADEDDCTEPGLVNGFDEKIVQVSAGDSHSAALSETGKVYAWGVFRDGNGVIGIFNGPTKQDLPTLVDLIPSPVVKIASGTDHLVCLTVDGDIYTAGCADQGQLGRVAEYFVSRGGRRGMSLLLRPAQVRFANKRLKFCDIWTGQYGTFCKAFDTGDIYAWGLNNYSQLGFPDILSRYVPSKSKSFESGKDWVLISGGQHHTLALDKSGDVYALGRKDYGRLGLCAAEVDLEEKSSPTLVPALKNKFCTCISSGSTVSFAVDKNGVIYSWGMGSGHQLGHGDDDDDVLEPKPVSGKQLENKSGLMVSAGGQHVVMLAQDKSS